MRAHCTAGLLLLLGLLAQSLNAQRLPNTTLTLPPEPPRRGYTLTPAFPTLSFTSPLVITSAPGETNRIFVAERAGQIYAITNLAQPTKTLFLDISSRVNPSGEGGLLGLAFHPGFQTNGWFFTFYTLTTNLGTASPSFHDRVSRFETFTDNPSLADPNSEVPLITQPDQASNHNGGDLHFGPDGYLYVATGDEGGANDTYRNSRRIDGDFFSAVLRLDVDEHPDSLPPNPHPAVGSGYSIPKDNPFVQATEFNGTPVDPSKVRTEFWAVGLRNPWRMSFDTPTGRLYCGDVGQNLWEEVNILQAGKDYGWNYREGLHPFTGTPPDGLSFEDPIWEYPHSGSSTNSGRSITGGVVYRGTRLSQLIGHYVFADFANGNVWSLLYDGSTVSSFQRITTTSLIAEFGEDPSNGDILAATLNGSILRLTYTDPPVGDPLPPTLADTGAFADLATLTPHPGIEPYSVNTPFWSDNAIKTRWFSIPDTNLLVTFSSSTPWAAPAGTVWIKHFDMEMTNGVPESRRRLETRFLVQTTNSSYGLTYRWDETQSNATLVPEEGLNETLLIDNGLGEIREQTWRYPSRGECAVCHTPVAGHALSFNTPQLNRTGSIASQTGNQIELLSRLGYFTNPPATTTNLPAFSAVDDASATISHRVRSYLAVNCVQCHQPGGVARGEWDARYSTALANAGIINGPLANTFNNAANRVLTPGNADLSMLLQRIEQTGPNHMPPLATYIPNQPAIDLLKAYILEDLPSLSLEWQHPENNPPALSLKGSPEIPVQLQSSTNLEQWSPNTNVTLNASGEFTLPLHQSPTSPAFYRLLLAP